LKGIFLAQVRILILTSGLLSDMLITVLFTLEQKEESH